MKKIEQPEINSIRGPTEKPTKAHRKTYPPTLKNINFFLLKFGFKKHQERVRKKKYLRVKTSHSVFHLSVSQNAFLIQ